MGFVKQQACLDAQREGALEQRQLPVDSAIRDVPDPLTAPRAAHGHNALLLAVRDVSPNVGGSDAGHLPAEEERGQVFGYPALDDMNGALRVDQVVIEEVTCRIVESESSDRSRHGYAIDRLALTTL